MMMRLTVLLVGLLSGLLVGCQESRPDPIASTPVSKDVVLPAGMPDDQWFYDEVVSSPVPVLVDFGATWCPPCQALKPVMEELKTKSNGQYKVVMVDIDERPNLAEHFRVHGIPHLLLIHHGKVEKSNLGPLSLEELEQFVVVPGT